jgi:hypothetical protein
MYDMNERSFRRFSLDPSKGADSGDKFGAVARTHRYPARADFAAA